MASMFKAFLGGKGRTSSAAAGGGGEGGDGGSPALDALGGPGANASTDIFIRLALEQIWNAKESKKLELLRDACRVALGTWWGRGGAERARCC
jgi:hypothetical protein